MTSPDPKTSKSDVGPDGAEDVQSDPAKGADEKSDWSDEGGAPAEGPAEESG